MGKVCKWQKRLPLHGTLHNYFFFSLCSTQLSFWEEYSSIERVYATRLAGMQRRPARFLTLLVVELVSAKHAKLQSGSGLAEFFNIPFEGDTSPITERLIMWVLTY